MLNVGDGVGLRVKVKGFHLAHKAPRTQTWRYITEHDLMNSLCHQPNAENAAIYLLIHQSFNIFDGLIQSARLRRQKCTGVTF